MKRMLILMQMYFQTKFKDEQKKRKNKKRRKKRKKKMAAGETTVCFLNIYSFYLTLKNID